MTLQETQIDIDGWEHEVDVYCFAEKCSEVAVEEHNVFIKGIKIKVAFCEVHNFRFRNYKKEKEATL